MTEIKVVIYYQMAEVFAVNPLQSWTNLQGNTFSSPLPNSIFTNIWCLEQQKGELI